MRPRWPSLVRDFLGAFVVLFVIFTLLRYFGWLSFAGTRGDLIASMRVELGPSLLWALVLVVVRFVRGR